MDEHANGHEPALPVPTSPLAARLKRACRRATRARNEERERLRVLETRLQDCQIVAARFPDSTGGAQAAGTVLKLMPLVNRQQDRLRAAEAALDRATYERGLDAHWQDREQVIFQALQEQYGRLGPQYAILLRRLVVATVRAERLEQAGRDVAVAEWRQVEQEVRAGVAALQRYTETEKMALVKTEVNAAIVAIVREVETVLASSHPELWQKVVLAIQERVQRGAEA
jgi:hypothetical protein